MTMKHNLSIWICFLIWSSLTNAAIRKRRGAHENNSKLWKVYRKDGKYIVPYEFSPKTPILKRKLIKEAMKGFEEQTCIRFKPKKGHRYFVQVKWQEHSDGKCGSEIGKQKNFRTTITLTPSCMTKAIIQHEIMHSLGFYHEQSRPDRDKYIKIHWKNINKENFHNFNVYKSIKSRSTPYDYWSIMHYNSFAFAKNTSKPTITTKNNKLIPASTELSLGDILYINTIYPCYKKKHYTFKKCSKDLNVCKVLREESSCNHYIYLPRFTTTCCATCNGFKNSGAIGNMTSLQKVPIGL